MGIIVKKLPVTIELNLISIVISLPLGIIIGIIAALNKDKPIDHVINTLIMIIIQMNYLKMSHCLFGVQILIKIIRLNEKYHIQWE